MNAAQLGEVLRVLKQEGFVAKRARGHGRVFDGAFKLSVGSVGVRLEVEDWDFLMYPMIRLLERPAFLPALTPHVGAQGDLCYFQQDSVVLDRFNPAGSILSCLRQAQQVLERMATNPVQRAQDLQDEFLAYWLLGQRRIWPVVLGSVEPDSESASYFVLGPEGARKVMICSSREEAARFARALNVEPPKGGAVQCWLIRSELYPAAPVKLPETVQELFAYLKSWDRAVYNKVQQVLERRQEYLKYSFITFAVNSPAGWLGFGFDLHPTTRQGYRRKPHCPLESKRSACRLFR
ncbi:MAG TPA: E2/UBC family protein [Nevskia sp.]|nr:E2/UBC family protein [Nevskia sp.]